MEFENQCTFTIWVSGMPCLGAKVSAVLPGLGLVEPQQPPLAEASCRACMQVAISGTADDGDGLQDTYCNNGVQPPGEFCTRAWLQAEGGEKISAIDTLNR